MNLLKARTQCTFISPTPPVLLTLRDLPICATPLVLGQPHGDPRLDQNDDSPTWGRKQNNKIDWDGVQNHSSQESSALLCLFCPFCCGCCRFAVMQRHASETRARLDFATAAPARPTQSHLCGPLAASPRARPAAPRTLLLPLSVPHLASLPEMR